MMRRQRSASVNRKPSEKKKIRERYQHCIHIFKANDIQNKRLVSNNGNNINSNNNSFSDSNSDIESLSSFSGTDSLMPIQQSNICHQQPSSIDKDFSNILDELWNMAPANAFAQLPSVADPINIALLNQVVPPLDPTIINPINSLQGQAGLIIDNMNNLQLQNDFTTNFTTFNHTVPTTTTIHQENNYHQNNGSLHHHHHHHGPTHYHSEPSIVITHNADQVNTFSHNNNQNSSSVNNNAAENLVETSPPSLFTPPPPQPPIQDNTSAIMTAENFVPRHQSHHRSDNMPTRPNPPSFQNGPKYFQATESFRSCFSQVDADDSGFITLEELRAFLQNKDRTSFNDEAVLTIMDMFDINNDNMIDASEFPDLLAYAKNWEACFTFLDADKSGTIDYSEMVTAFKALGFTNLSHKFIVKLLKKYDRAHRGQIELDNFILACVTLCRYKDTYEFMRDRFGSSGPPLDLEQFLSALIWPASSHH